MHEAETVLLVSDLLWDNLKEMMSSKYCESVVVSHRVNFVLLELHIHYSTVEL